MLQPVGTGFPPPRDPYTGLLMMRSLWKTLSEEDTNKTVCANPDAQRLDFRAGRSRDITLPSHKSEMQSSKPLYRQDPGVIELGDL